MTTRELADFTGMANQTINRWIREKKWKTERFPGVKGGRARLVVIDHEVKEFLYGVRKCENVYHFHLKKSRVRTTRLRCTASPSDKFWMQWKRCRQWNKKNLLCSLLVKGFAIFSPGLILTNQRKKTAGVFLLPFIFYALITAGFRVPQ